MQVKQLSTGEKVFRVVSTLILLLIIFVMLYPVWYVIVCSFSSLSHVQNTTFILWPDGLHLEAYQQVFRNELVPTAYGNTLFITIVGTLMSMFLTILGAFVLSRKDLPGRNLLTFFVVFTMLFSGGLVPLYLQVRRLNLLNTLWSLILPVCISTYNLIIMRNFFQGVPDALYEAAVLDGASVTTYLWRFYAVDYWNAYYYALIFITKKTVWPMQALLRQIIMSSELDSLMYDDGIQNIASEMLKDAMIVVTALPIICVYPFLQRYFVKGVMVGSLKG